MSTVSLVDISPSIVMRLKLSSTHSNTALRSDSRGMLASVVMKHSIVAMLGEIMPAPFTQPPRRTRCSPRSNETAISFARVSLVMIAAATSDPFFGPSPAMSVSVFGSKRDIGIGRPMTPVEDTPISVRFRPSGLATASHIALASRMPCTPVQALALPELAMMARRSPLRRCACETRTGAAFTRLVVKVPAELHGRSEYTSARSSRVAVGFLMPHAVALVRNPSGAPTPPLMRV